MKNKIAKAKAPATNNKGQPKKAVPCKKSYKSLAERVLLQAEAWE